MVRLCCVFGGAGVVCCLENSGEAKLEKREGVDVMNGVLFCAMRVERGKSSDIDGEQL